MDGVTVPVAVVASRTEAELIVGLLRSNGLSAAVSADDAGGLEPQLQLEGVRVLVAPAAKPRPVSSWPPWRRRMPIADRMTRGLLRGVRRREELGPPPGAVRR